MSGDTFRRLAALGLTTDQIAGVLDLMDEATAKLTSADEERKEKARARWHKWKTTHPANVSPTLANVSQHLQTLANDSREPAHVEDNLPSKKISGKEENKKTPRDELAAVLDTERADAVVEHRQRLRKPLTSRAAKMLAVELAKAPDPNAAADLMLAKGWTGFDIGWLEGRTAPRATSPPDRMSQRLEALKRGDIEVADLLNGKSHDIHTIDASYERTDRGGAGHPVQDHAVPPRR